MKSQVCSFSLLLSWVPQALPEQWGGSTWWLGWPLLRPDSLLPAEVPSMQDVHVSSRDPRMSLGPQVAPTSGEKLSGSPQPRAQEMEVEGGAGGLGGMEKVGLVWTDGGEQPGGDRRYLFLLLSRFQRPVVAPPGATLSPG